ncbi:MAG: hypothetical protein ABJN04_01695 [Hyphomicrobiales bacterium]
MTVHPCSAYNPLTERRGGQHRSKHSVIQTETPLANAEAVFGRSESASDLIGRFLNLQRLEISSLKIEYEERET